MRSNNSGKVVLTLTEFAAAVPSAPDGLTFATKDDVDALFADMELPDLEPADITLATKGDVDSLFSSVALPDIENGDSNLATKDDVDSLFGGDS